jgi:hypothetical protein
VGIADVEKGFPVVGGEGGMDAVGADSPHAEDSVIAFSEASNKAREFADELVGLGVGVEAGAGLEDDVEEGHVDLGAGQGGT